MYSGSCMIDTDDMAERLPHNMKYLSNGISVAILFNIIKIGDLETLKTINRPDAFQIQDLCLELAIRCNHFHIVQYLIYTHKLYVSGYFYKLAIRHCSIDMFIMMFEHISINLITKDLDPSPFNNYNQYEDYISEIIYNSYGSIRLDIIKYMLTQSKKDNEDSFIRIVDMLLTCRSGNEIDIWMKQFMIDNAKCIVKYNMNRYVNHEFTLVVDKVY
jgi:hypothetical protein